MKETTKKLTTSAVMIALGSVLSILAVFQLPNGGSVTIASMVPVLLIALMYDTKWAIFTSITYSLLQMVLRFSPPPAQDFLSFVLVVLLDYVIAFGVLGLAGVFYRMMGQKRYAIPLSGAIVIALRFMCHFLSGILIWRVYAPEGQNPAYYSLVYNGSYLLAELGITIVVLVLLSKFIQEKLIK